MFEIVDFIVIKVKDDVFEKYGWKVKVKDTTTNKSFSVKCFIRKLDQAFICTNIPENYFIDDSNAEIEELIRDYLITKQEIYTGEDGDSYLVGEDE